MIPIISEIVVNLLYHPTLYDSSKHQFKIIMLMAVVVGSSTAGISVNPQLILFVYHIIRGT